MGRKLLAALCAAAGLWLPAMALAQETVTYTYDQLGRVVTVQHGGTVNAGTSESYSYDAAGNRSNVTVAGVPTPPSFAIAPATAVAEGGTLVYTVTKNGAGAASVSFATANGTAIAGSDYNSTTGTLNFASGDATKTISVTTIDDSAIESAETVLVNLSSPTSGATISTAQASGTINDNDVAPSFAISGAAPVTEGGTLVYTVTKTGAGAADVSFATASGSATSGSDFTANSGTLSFASGDTTKTISVATIDDSATESSETVLVNLSSPTNGATIATAQGSGSITDNDGASTIQITDSFLGVVSSQTAVYGCSSQDFNTLDGSYHLEKCWLKSNNHNVYYNKSDAPEAYLLAPGYSFQFGSRLYVLASYYGTAP